MTNLDYSAIAELSLSGELPDRLTAKNILNAPDVELLEQLAAAYRVRHHYWSNRVRLHFLLNAQSGLCPEDCNYCSQSKISSAEIEKYPLIAQERIVQAADRAASLKAGTFCMAISGRSPSESVFKNVLEAFEAVKSKHDLKICACLGILNESQTKRLAAVGVDRVNHNLNTSENHHQNICSTHTFRDRVNTIKNVQKAGITTCSGGILGMNESDEDIIDLAYSLRELNVTSVPINFLIPIAGTPLAEINQLNPRRCLRILNLFRLILPQQEIRIAGGREVHLRSLQVMGLYPANSIFVGDYLTTVGQAASNDLGMIRDAGFVLENPDGSVLKIEDPTALAVEFKQALSKDSI